MAQYFRSTDCSKTDIFTVADTMDDLATLLEDIGFENLLEQLGVDFSFDVNGFNFDPLNTTSNF